MSTMPPLPPPLEQSGDRHFSFYPPILNIEHNEWLYREATWAEMLVVNTKSGAELWVPRRYVGEVSRVDEPVMIVGLLKELEYKGGQVWPHERRVLEIPKVGPAPGKDGQFPAPLPAHGTASALASAALSTTDAERKMGKLLIAAVGLALLVCVGVIAWSRGVLSGGRVHYLAVLQGNTGLTAKDDYWGVVRRFGQPAEDRWFAAKGDMQFRVLRYRKPDMNVVLMGIEQNDKARYIGALNEDGKVMDSVALADGRNTQALLYSLAARLADNPNSRP